MKKPLFCLLVLTLFACSEEKRDSGSNPVKIESDGSSVRTPVTVVANEMAVWVGEYVFYDSPTYSEVMKKEKPNSVYYSNTIHAEDVAYAPNSMHLFIVEHGKNLVGRLTLTGKETQRTVRVKIRGTKRKIDVLYQKELTEDEHFEKVGDVLLQLEWRRQRLVTIWKSWYPRYKNEDSIDSGFEKLKDQ